jgi:hypothetical protein
VENTDEPEKRSERLEEESYGQACFDFSDRIRE